MYKLHENDPNILNWKVYGADIEIGEVVDLIVDLQLMQAVYIEVELHDRFKDTDQRLYVLIPVTDMHLNKDKRRVRVPFLDKWNIESYPSYHEKVISDDLERKITNYPEYIPDRVGIGDGEDINLDPAANGYYAATLRLKYLEMKKEEALKELVSLNKEIAKTKLKIDIEDIEKDGE